MKDRIKEIGRDVEAADELALLKSWLALAGDEAGLKKQLREAETALDAKVYGHYATLSVDEVQVLVVEDKWLGALEAAIHGEMDRVSQALTRRVRELAERYECPLPVLVERVAELQVRVAGHLGKMGFVWN